MSFRRRARLAGWPLTLVVGLIGAAPILASTARALADRWMPAGDQGIIATRAYDVFSSHTPLVGQYSLVSTITGHLTYSPGPMLYWLIALPARFGSPHAIALTIGLTNAWAVVAIVALARSRGGVGLMIAAALALAFTCRSFMPEALHDNWNPSAGLLPFALLVFLCWSLACGERRLLPAVALVGSFTAQCQVAFLAPTVALVVLAVLGLAHSWRKARSGRLWPWALAATLLLVACWTPPLIDQIEHSPGNLTLLYRAATQHAHTVGATEGVHAVVRALGIPPRWLRVPGDPFDTRTTDATTAPGQLALVSAVAILLALAAALIAGIRRRRADVAWAALIGLVLCAVFGAIAAHTPATSQKVLGYTLWWGSIAGMWVWLMLGWSALVLVGGPLAGAVRLLVRRRSTGALAAATWPARGGPLPAHGGPLPGSALASALGLAATVAAGLAISLGQVPDAHSAEYGPIASLSTQVDRAHLPRGATVWLRSTLSGVASPLSQAIKFILRRHSLRILQRGATARLGPWYELDHHSYDYVVYAYDGPRVPDLAARVVARVALDESRAPFPGATTRHRLRLVTISFTRATRRAAPPRSQPLSTPRSARR